MPTNDQSITRFFVAQCAATRIKYRMSVDISEHIACGYCDALNNRTNQDKQSDRNMMARPSTIREISVTEDDEQQHTRVRGTPYPSALAHARACFPRPLRPLLFQHPCPLLEAAHSHRRLILVMHQHVHEVSTAHLRGVAGISRRRRKHGERGRLGGVGSAGERERA